MHRRQLIVLVLALCLLALPAAGARPGAADQPVVEDWCGVWCDAWRSTLVRAWAHLWTHAGPPEAAGGVVDGPPLREAAGDPGAGLVSAATACEDPTESGCESYPDVDPDG